MKRNLRSFLLVFFIVGLAFLPFVVQDKSLIANASEEVSLDQLDESASLSEKLNAILMDQRLDGAIAGVSVRHQKYLNTNSLCPT